MKVHSALTILVALSCCDRIWSQQTCSICGDGMDISIENEVVVIPGEEGGPARNISCGALRGEAEIGAITEAQCSALFDVVNESCGCMMVGDDTDPEEMPTNSTEPTCYDDINEISDIEDSLEDVSVQREYILCPNTEYMMGRGNPDGSYLGGFAPIVPRPNVHYKCGANGSRENNCVITGGDFHLLSLGIGVEFDTNVVLEGFIFEKAIRGGFLLAHAGDITFVDCIFRLHQNFGVFLVLYNGPPSRRLQETVSKGDYSYIEELLETGEMTSTHRARDTQELVTDFFLTLQGCIFEENTAAGPGGSARPGIISVTTSFTSLSIEDCIFRNNYFGADDQPSTYAVSTPGDISIVNSCFIDNELNRLAPVVTTGEPLPSVVAQNNYGTVDGELACQFLAQFTDADAMEALNSSTCLEFDANECLAVVEETNPPQPTPAPVQPTRKPVQMATTPPVVDPIATPTMAPTDGKGSASSSTGLSSAPLAISIFAALEMNVLLM